MSHLPSGKHLFTSIQQVSQSAFQQDTELIPSPGEWQCRREQAYVLRYSWIPASAGMTGEPEAAVLYTNFMAIR
jgi:hypothetical protein